MRHKPVVRRRRADDDIEAAVAYYLAEAGDHVAADFLNRLESALESISRQPGMGSQLDIANLRQWPMKQFPYPIFYVEKERRIEIARVLHSKGDIALSKNPR